MNSKNDYEGNIIKYLRDGNNHTICFTRLQNVSTIRNNANLDKTDYFNYEIFFFVQYFF